MIRHVVMWSFAEQAGGHSRAENLARIRAMLEALPAQIDGIERFEVGIDERGGTDTHLVLVSDFRDWGALEAYKVHPAHQEVVAALGEVRDGRWVVDYEL
jgi:quinol monooxygenase YgiN